MNKSNETLRWARTQRDEGWSGNAEWDGKEDGEGWVSAIGWAAVSAVILWAFIAALFSVG